MKKQFFILLILFLSTSVFAQKKDNHWLGGSFGITSTTIKTDEGKSDYLNINIVPEFGTYVDEKIGLGLIVGFSRQEIELKLLGENSFIDFDKFTIGGFVRYVPYKTKLVGVFFDGGIDYSVLNGDNFDASANELSIGIKPGISCYLSERVSLIAKFGFLGYNYFKMDKNKITVIGGNFDLDNLLIGINFNF